MMSLLYIYPCHRDRCTSLGLTGEVEDQTKQTEKGLPGRRRRTRRGGAPATKYRECFRRKEVIRLSQMLPKAK